MKLTAKLAYSQLKINRNRTIWTIIGILLSTAMITAVYSFAASGIVTLIEFRGSSDFSNYTALITSYASMGTILSLIIVATSVIVISNAFRVSAGERTAQFGILKSVGATKRQIAVIVMREGFLLSVVGVPLGILLGIFLEFTGLQIANYFLADINTMENASVPLLKFVISWQAILASIVIAFVTVIISTWLPARKAAKITAIDAIRGTGEVKIKPKTIRANRLVSKLFGFEGTLASKSFKRSRRNFRATVLSLTISIILFISAQTFGTVLIRTAEAEVSLMQMPNNAAFNTVYIAMVFIYCFIGLVTFIGLTNVISTISTNIRSRSREFAVLQSVGMTRNGLKRMLNLESIICSAKSILIGLPVGLAMSVLIHYRIRESLELGYEFPWLACVLSIISVFAIAWITMRYAASRLRGGSVVEIIRSERGI